MVGRGDKNRARQGPCSPAFQCLGWEGARGSPAAGWQEFPGGVVGGWGRGCGRQDLATEAQRCRGHPGRAAREGFAGEAGIKVALGEVGNCHRRAWATEGAAGKAWRQEPRAWWGLEELAGRAGSGKEGLKTSVRTRPQRTGKDKHRSGDPRIWGAAPCCPHTGGVCLLKPLQETSHGDPGGYEGHLCSRGTGSNPASSPASLGNWAASLAVSSSIK